MQKLTAGKLNFVPPMTLAVGRIGSAHRASENSSASQLKLNNLLVLRKWSDVRSFLAHRVTSLRRTIMGANWGRPDANCLKFLEPNIICARYTGAD